MVNTYCGVGNNANMRQDFFDNVFWQAPNVTWYIVTVLIKCNPNQANYFPTCMKQTNIKIPIIHWLK